MGDIAPIRRISESELTVKRTGEEPREREQKERRKKRQKDQLELHEDTQEAEPKRSASHNQEETGTLDLKA